MVILTQVAWQCAIEAAKVARPGLMGNSLCVDGMYSVSRQGLNTPCMYVS